MSYNSKRIIDMLEGDLEKVIAKNDISESDLEKLCHVSKTLYYLSVYDAMHEEGEYSGRYDFDRMPPVHYYGDNRGRNQYSNANYSMNNYNSGRRGYSGHDDSERMMLEKMMREARNDQERELFRQKLNEFDQMR